MRPVSRLWLPIRTCDPLFLADPTDPNFNPDLPPFDESNSKKPAFEFPFLMKGRGLILENIKGFDVDEITGDLIEPPVFRAPPALINLEFSAPFGYNGNFANTQDFTVGAVIQHFPKTLNRVPGTDFRLPTQAELDDMEAFMLSNTSPEDGKFKTSGAKSILSTSADKKAQDTSRREVRGRNLFSSKGCTSCHGGTVLGGGNRNTGVEDLVHPDPLLLNPTVDTGSGGQFQTFPLFGLRKPALFHNNAIGNNTTPLPGETLRFTNLRDAVAFYVSPEFKASNTGGQVSAMTEAEIQDIAAFLEAISNK